MRVAGVIALLVLGVQVLLGLAFAAGYYWIGGWLYGLICAAALLLLMLLPWLGELMVSYRSDGQAFSVKLGWWGAASYQAKPEPHMRLRVLFIPWRKSLKPKAAPQPKPEKPTDEVATKVAEAKRVARAAVARTKGVSWSEVGPEQISHLARAGLAALQMGNDLIWDASELSVQVRGASQNASVDSVLAAVVGHRGVGPIDLRVRDGGATRSVRMRYRIGLLRLGLGGLVLMAQSRPLTLRKLFKSAGKRDAETKEESKDV